MERNMQLLTNRKGRRALGKLTKKQAVKEWLKQFKTSFDIKDDAIDLRTMSENYDHGIIPLEDIHQTVAVAGNIEQEEIDYDPEGDKTSPQFKYVTWDQLFLWTLFQRDVAPNHILKIIRNFLRSCVSVPMAVKFTIDGKEYYCVWDGHHTLQSMRFKGYKKFPLWFIDIDDVDIATIENAGFAGDTQGRIEYGVWLAGRNMVNINAKIKRVLSPYDQFMIERDTKDARALAMTNILNKNNCTPKRHATMAGAWTQIKSGMECYELADTYGNKGMFWDRALHFNRTYWPRMHCVLELFRPMSYLYHAAHVQGLVLDEQFDKELADALIKRYGDAESVQEAIKDSCEDAIKHNKGSGNLLKVHKDQVLAGLINIYNQDVGRLTLPPAEYVWKV